MKNLAIIQGGGCRQIQCAAGVLKALDEKSVKLTHYRGASAGGIVAALHASGLTGIGIAELIAATPVDDLFSFSAWQGLKLFIPAVEVDYVYNRDGMARFIEKNINELHSTGRVLVSVTRSDGRSLMAPANLPTLLATSAIPEVFPPVKINGYYYVDGGVKNNIPTCSIKQTAEYDHIYIILCNDDTPHKKRSWTKTGRSLQALNETMEREAVQIRDVARWGELDNVTVIQPPPYRSHLLDWSEGLVEHAYNYTRKLLD